MLDNKLNFKQYYSKKIKDMLVNESLQKTIRFSTTHQLIKYGKVPLSESHNEKSYISFRPRDIIIVEWERNLDKLIPLTITINELTYSFVWTNEKSKSWIESNALQLL